MTPEELRRLAEQAWADAFAATGVTPVRPGDCPDDADFLLLGGNSLTALAASEAVADATGREVPVRLLLGFPRLADYVEALSLHLPTAPPREEAAPREDPDGPVDRSETEYEEWVL